MAVGPREPGSVRAESSIPELALSRLLAAGSVGATLVLVGGIGACIGPPVAAALMGVVGPNVFFVFLAGVHAVIGLFAVYRMSQRASKPLEEQGPTVPVGSGAGAGTNRLSALIMRNLRVRAQASTGRSGESGK